MPSQFYRLWDRLPFAGRLLFTASFVLLVVAMVMLYTAVKRDARFADESLRSELATNLDTLPAALAEFVIVGDYATLQQTLDRYVRQANLASIDFVDPSGVRLTSVDVPQPALAPAWFDRWVDMGEYDGEEALEVGGHRYGVFTMHVSPRMFIDRAWVRFGHHLTLLALALGLNFLAMYMVLRFGLRPLRTLAEGSAALAAGDLSVRIPEEGAPELRRSMAGFNHMAAALERLVDEVKASRAALAEEKERAQVTLTSIGDGVITTDTEGRIEFMNPVAEGLTGWSLADALGRPMESVFAIIREEDRLPQENPARRALLEGKVVGLANHTLLITRDGRELNIEDSAAPIRAQDGEIIGVVLVFHDVTESHRMTSRLNYQASHDALTGLINRSEFERQLARLVEQARSNDKSHALLYIDLDQFKVINDTCGHVAGDDLLRQISGILQPWVRQGDVIARLGGDEFGVLLMDCDVPHGQEIAKQIMHALHDFRFVWEGRQFPIGASMGLVPINATLGSAGAILAAADTACFAAKAMGRNRIQTYHAHDSELSRMQGEMEWVSRIHHAVEAERLELYAQPIAAMSVSDEAHHFEVLLRMRDESGDIIPPSAFIPAAEHYGLMQTLDRWVVGRMLEWIEAHPDFKGTCSINLSGQSLGDEYFLAFLLDALHGRNIDCGVLCFEVTETAAIANLNRAVHFMKELRARGCRFSLDDFGSGLSSFAYLKSLPVDYLKIDGNFVKGIVSNPIDRAMVEAIHTVSRAMSLVTIAEFAEDEAILAVLREIGVDYAQGYGIGHPAPLSQLAV